MSRGQEITLKNDFLDITQVYIDSLPRALDRMELSHSDAEIALQAYENVIRDNATEIYRSAAYRISGYLNFYQVHANQSADEYKLIYFLGRAIEARLIASGFAEVARCHMLSMIGLLDYRLLTIGIVKTTLSSAMGRLVRFNQFDDRLGSDGCYLTYKCVSTTPRDAAPVQAL